MPGFDIFSVETPCYAVDERLIEKNMRILRSVSERTGCRVLLAQKAFSMYSLYPLMAQFLDGTTASGLYEARLGFEEMKGKEVHIFSPAYRPEEFEEITNICGHIVFNSFSQLKRFIPDLDKAQARGRHIEVGMRVNPEYSEIETEIYNPCAGISRLGVKAEDFEEAFLDRLSGLHFHTMCEQGSDVLERTIPHFEEKFGRYLPKMKWVNFGGGHHVTREDYDVDRLVRVISYVQDKYGVQVYIEPGEACALNAGFLVASVLEVFESGGYSHAIIDASAACHMPDVLEMPYRPRIIGAGEKGEKAYSYLIGAATCLAGDSIGVYSFDKPLSVGDRLVFCDMAIYSMCKNNTFNGIGLPSIYRIDKQGRAVLHKKFGYDDFKCRL
ncbi:MAG: carboxynorspermidine decarboxylase [Oscillospiraceae bacterium]|nr:carboxynorspermidine decarboxylase [Oscillospiraceae bacterium]